MQIFLLITALASAAASTPVVTNLTTVNYSLPKREVESSEHPNLQINTYGSGGCNGGFAINDAQYGLKQQTVNTASIYLTRDLLDGENLHFFTDAQCSHGFPDHNNTPDKTGGAKGGCYDFGDNNIECFQLVYTSQAPAAVSAGVNQAACDFSYKVRCSRFCPARLLLMMCQVVMDSFVMRRKNFNREKMKPDGSGLKKQVQGCGALSAWSFKMTPQDPQYQWMATGNLPVGTESCMGSALQLAGGSSAGNFMGQG